MTATDTNFETFARALIPAKPTPDPTTLRRAKCWYSDFAGIHAVAMPDDELIAIYTELN